MKSRFTALILALAIVAAPAFTGCRGSAQRIEAVPAVVANADQDVRAAAAKALGILTSTAKFVNGLSKAETAASLEPGFPATADAAFDRAMREYTDASDAAVKRIVAGVSSWSDLKAILDPVIARANGIAALGDQFSVIRSRFGEWLASLRDAVIDLAVSAATGARPVSGGFR